MKDYVSLSLAIPQASVFPEDYFFLKEKKIEDYIVATFYIFM